MTSNRPTPIIIGVGDIKNKSLKPEDALEPLDLIFQAIQLAIKDTAMTGFFATDLQSSIDDISIVATWTWPYPDLPGLLATKLGVQPRYKHYSEHGGNQPGKLLDEAARRISLGESRVAVVAGGEALASCMYLHLPSSHSFEIWDELNIQPVMK
jgi:acetyl-CoA acetyltransferase